MKKLYLVMVAAVLVMTASCNKEEALIEPETYTTLTATVGNDTKVGFVKNTGDFFWTKGDEIGVYNFDKKVEVKGSLAKMALSEGEGTGKGVFTINYKTNLGEYAIYPYRQEHNLNLENKELTYNIPTWQTVKLDDAIPEVEDANKISTNAPMWGKIEGNSVKFQHLGGVFCINLKGLPLADESNPDNDKPGHKFFNIVLTADGQLGGQYLVNLNDKTPLLKSDPNVKGTLTRKIEDNQRRNGVLYVPVPTGKFTNLQISVNGKVWKTYPEVTVNRKDLIIMSAEKPAEKPTPTVTGADWANAKNYTIGVPSTEDDRWGAFDGKNIAVIGPNSYYISLEDVIAGKTTLSSVDVTGISGNWPHVTVAQMDNGHMYFVPLSKESEVLKVFYKESPTSKAEEIYKGTCGKLRYADGMSMDLDENGNGYIFLQGSNNNATKDVVRLHITNYKTVDELVTLSNKLQNSWTYDTVTKIEESEEYIHSGRDCNPCIIDKDYKPIFDFKNKNGDPVKEMQSFASIRIINFNGKRYMYGINSSDGNTKVAPHIYVYDASKGNTPQEGILGFLNSWPKQSLYDLEISATPGTYAVADYYIEKDASGKDSKLYLYAASGKSGFKIIAIPAAK